jgi:selenide,water dikinase
VYRLPDGLGLVQTVDFFTPIVDDPFDWGRIAAANAMSDVYAMGGRPVTALNLVAWPVDDLPLEMLSRVLEGGATAARQAGVVVLGGHSIHDPEPKYGMAVMGFVELDRIVRNSTMQQGDRLILTKPLGLGITSTAIKAGVATPEQVSRAVEVMTTLNEAAAQAMTEVGASAATDVTGFGLLGHLHIALRASGAAAVLDPSAVPVLRGTLELARRGMIPSGTRANHDFVDPHVDWAGLPEDEQLVLADAQTSGGLLIAIREAGAGELRAGLERRGIPAAEIGVVEYGAAGRIRLVPKGRITEVD